MSPWEVDWLVQSPQQHHCASSRAPTAQRRPRRRSRKLSAIRPQVTTVAQHSPVSEPQNSQYCKNPKMNSSSSWTPPASPATLAQTPALLCPPPTCLPQGALLYGLTYRLELSSFLIWLSPSHEGTNTHSVRSSNKQEQHPQTANIYKTKHTAGGRSLPHLQGTGTPQRVRAARQGWAPLARSLPEASWQSLEGITKLGIYFHKWSQFV